jgi:MFS family permease
LITDRLRSPSLWYHGWNVVALCVLVQIAALGLTLNCFSLFLHDWTREFGMPVSDFALGISIFSLGCALVAPFAGLAADRVPARWLLSAMLLALALFHLALSFANGGWQVVALYAVLLPVAVTLSSGIPSQTIVSRWFVRRVGLAMGLTAFGLALAGVLFPSLIVVLLPLYGWRVVWRLFAGLIALGVLPMVLLGMRDRPGPAEGTFYVDPASSPPVASAQDAAQTWLTVRQVFARRNFWVIVGTFVPIQCASISMTVNLTPIVVSHGFTPRVAGLMIAVLSISALVAKLAAGAAADRFGNRRPMIVVAILCAGGLAALINAAGNLPLMTLAFVLLGLSAGVWTLLASATAAEFGRAQFGRAFGLVCMFPPVASLAPPLVARLREDTGSYTPGLSVLLGLAVGAALVASRLREAPVAHKTPAG